jgi:carbamoyltransferase
MTSVIVGGKCIGHDTSIFVLQEGEKPFALDRERVTRFKHDIGFPYEPLEMAKKLMSEKGVVFSYPDKTCSYRDFRIASNRILHSPDLSNVMASVKTNPLLDFARRFRHTHVVNRINSAKVQNIVSSNLNSVIKKNWKLIPRDHHECHAASAFFYSGFKKACIITLDGEGDGISSRIMAGKDTEMESISKTDRNNSIGHVYGAFTEALGLRRDHDEGKVEALGGYGNPDSILFKKIRGKFKVKGLQIVIDPPFNYKNPDLEMYKSIAKQYGEKDTAAAIQRVLEKVGLELVQNAMDETGIRNLALSGGCFANVQMNMRIFEELKPEKMYIFPAMGDNGTSAGAALMTAAEEGWDLKKLRFDMPYFGPEFGQDEIKKALEKYKGRLSYVYREDWPEYTAELLARGEIIGWFQGRMEYGPRALGNRSVLADPAKPGVKDTINNTIKRRKPYQPFCPSVLESERERIFKKTYRNKHMTCAFRLKEKWFGKLKGGAHIDGSARPQFVEKEDNPNYFRMITAFKKIKGYGFIINTSFNLHGRPIVMKPEDAVVDFIDCGLNYLVMDGWVARVKSH